MTDVVKLWIEAGKTIELNPAAIISCPVCKIGTLIIKDELFGDNKIDRYMICDTCQQYNIITMQKPD